MVIKDNAIRSLKVLMNFLRFPVSDRGNSMEDDIIKSPCVGMGGLCKASLPPSTHPSPSRQSSSSIDPEVGVVPGGGVEVGSQSIGTLVARKKRELFSSGRSSRSGESNQSSKSDSNSTRENSSKVGMQIFPSLF